MIDIHNHVIFGVDDGAASIKDSLRMILEAERMGVTVLIATPHYNNNIYASTQVQENFNELKYYIKDLGIDLFLGYEVFLSTALDDVLEDQYKYTLAGSKYLLFELPFEVMPVDLDKVLQKLLSQGLIPIIAHPERYSYFSHNIERFQNFIDNGCLVQLDAGSILGVHGKEAKQFCKKVIDMHLVHFIASDAHRPEDYFQYKKAYELVKNWAGEEYCISIFNINPKAIINTRAQH